MTLKPEWSGELEQMLRGKAAPSQLAGLLDQVLALGIHQMNLLAQLCQAPMELLTIENARQWPEGSAASLAAFAQYVLLPPPSAHPPCTPRDLFVAAALADPGVSKALRVALWQMMVMDGMIIPCFAGGNRWDHEWEVPDALSDHAAVREWRCLTKQPGWEELRCSDAYRFGAHPKPLQGDEGKRVEEAIEEDSPAALMMPLDIAGKEIPHSLINLLMAKQAVRIAMDLYQKNARFQKEFPRPQLLLYVCSNWNRAEVVPFVERLEADQPGLAKETKDAFGHDALWYTLYQVDEFRRGSRKRSPLARKLIEMGCNPEWKNSLGLCYYDLTEDESQ